MYCGRKRVSVKYYYNPGCPHCRNFMGAWDRFSRDHSGTANITKVNCAEDPVGCANITAVPHVVFSTSKGDVVYSGDRSYDSLVSHLNSL